VKRLLIDGAGGFGREVLTWASDIRSSDREWEIGGFLDATPTALKPYPCSLPILGDPLAFPFTEDDVLACAVGDPVQRLTLCRELRKRGASFTTLIHPSAIVGSECRLGEGCILCPGVVVTTNVTVGDYVCLNVGTCVGHDVVIGDGCTLSPHSDIGGHAKLGEGVFLGTHAVVLPSAVVGDYAVVGAGSIVLRRVRPRVTVVGVPGREVFRSTGPGAKPGSN
jgi:sugar O-acyltransferase (sialic acid O-acetyltransferase NeuD family)